MDTKYNKWREKIVIKKFRNEKKMIDYINQSEEFWQIVDNKTLPEKAGIVFDLDNHTFYMNKKNQFINTYYKFLYDTNIITFVENFLLPDTEDFPIMGELFKECNDTEILESKILEAFKYFNLQHSDSKSKILKTLDDWIYNEMLNKLKPKFYEEKYYCYLLLIMGFLMIKKDKTLRWRFESKISQAHKDSLFFNKEYYAPILTSNVKTYDVLFAFRQTLFLYSGRFSNLFSKTYKYLENTLTSNFKSYNLFL